MTRNMGGYPILQAVALMLVLEGLLPFISPSLWRESMRRIASMQDGQIRFFGLIAVSTGLLMIFLLD